MSSTLIATVLAHTASALLAAVIFAALARPTRDLFLRDWSWSWFALASGVMLATMWEWLRTLEPTLFVDATVLVVAALTGVTLYLHLAWILTGVARLRYDERRATPPLLLRPVGTRLLVLTSVVLGASTYVAAALARDPAMVTMLRAEVRGLIAGVVFISVAARIWRAPRAGRGIGQRLAAGATALVGIDQFLEAALPLQFVTEMVPNMPADVDVGYIEFGLTFAIALSVVIWRLEEERRATREFAARLDSLALSDDVTGLPNRLVVVDRLGVAIEGARRAGTGIAICHLRADGGADEQTVRVVAGRLASALRAVDTVARLEDGGFALVAPGIARPEDAMQIVRRALEALQRSRDLDGAGAPVTARCGVALYPDDGDTPDALLTASEQALIGAEDGRFHFASAAAHERAVERLSLERSLRYALGNGELALRYQPVVRAETGRVEAVEASVCWRHPTRGLLTPDRFLTAAEETGMAAPIGEWAVHAVCIHLREWRLRHTSLRASLPLSARLLRHEGFAVFVANALVTSGVPPTAFELVVREDDVSHDDERVAAVLRDLRRAGHPVVVDRFGAAAASLALLVALPADAVKLAPELLHDTNGAAGPTLRAYAAAAGALGVRVLASGVRGEADLEMAVANGCASWQGPLCSEPLSGQELGDLLAKEWPVPAPRTVG